MMDETDANTTSSLAGPGQPPEAVKDEDMISQERSAMAKAGSPSAVAPTTTPSAMLTLQSFMDHALHFLSHASNGTLGAYFAGLGLATYLLLGRVGLVIIGLASGVVLQATWEGVRSDNRDEASKQAELARRRETGIEVARRVLDLRSGRQSSDEKTRSSKLYIDQAFDYSNFGPETSVALEGFTDAVIQGYVNWWYDPVIPNENSFPASCRQTFIAFVLSLSGHLQRKRSADVFLDFVTNASSIIIVFLTELASALNASPNASAEDAISAYLKMKPESSLSYMLDQESQKSKLAETAEDILQAYLDPKAYNCKPMHSFLKEVLAQIVLGYTLGSCSRPEWINDWIVYGLEESETTKEVMDIVDAGMQGRAKNDSSATSQNAEGAGVKSKKEGAETSGHSSEHRRQISRAEEAMDDAMQEARRLTELMIAEDERLAKRVQENEFAEGSSSEVKNISERITPSFPAPDFRQSGLDEHDDKALPVTESERSLDVGTPVAEPLQDTSPGTPQFTNFEQILPNTQPTALMTEDLDKPKQSLTLCNAIISIFDDSVPGERVSIKAKPNIDYLIQIEPASSSFPGWMIQRKYADFETLHEVLRRISVITGSAFTESHAELPKWRVNTKSTLRNELERYLCDAVRYQQLAESEGMKRFLEKERGFNKSPNGTAKGFGWPTPEAFGKLGGDMMGVLTKAPKQVAGGGKAMIGGVAGLVGAGKRQSQSQVNVSKTALTTTIDEAATNGHRGQSSLSYASTSDSRFGSLDAARESQDSLKSRPNAALERRGSNATTTSTESRPRPSNPTLRPSSMIEQEGTVEPVAAPSNTQSRSPAQRLAMEEAMNLPPPPSEMPADYISPTSPSRKSTDTFRSLHTGANDQRVKDVQGSESHAPSTPPRTKAPTTNAASKPKEVLSERETGIAVELVFAVITQLYTLSSAWQFRRTLLTAVKTFLLRPGNVQLISIQNLLQTSLLDSNLSDPGLAHHIYKLRANALPTDEEMEIWKRDFPEKTDEQKDELRIKARKLLVTKGMPQALTSVMGAAASGEALGKVFDCLQIPDVSRGLIYGLMRQALRVLTH